MSNYWMIRELENGYVVTYPTGPTVQTGEMFTATFEGALKLCENNSLLSTPEDALKSK